MAEYQRPVPPVREFADRGIRWLLEAPENLRGLFTVLSLDLSRSLDFPRMVVLPGTFIPANLRKQEADLVVRVPYREGEGEAVSEVLVYVLVEYQSLPDLAMAYRLLSYMVALWDRQRRDLRKRRVPAKEWRFLPIVPLVLYTGTAPWDAPADLARLMDLPAPLAPFVPRFETLFLNLKATAPAELLRSGHPFAHLLRVIQEENAPAERLAAALRGAVAHLDTMAEAERDAWERALQYLVLLVYHRREPEQGRRLVEGMDYEIRAHGRREGADVAKTLYEEVVEKGRKEGILLTKRGDLLGLLVEKFGAVPEDMKQRVGGLTDIEMLDRYLKRVIHADSLDAMGL